MDVTWLDREHPDERDLAGAAVVIEAARAVDCPHEPLLTVSSLRARLRHGWDGHPGELAVTRDDRGRVIGVLWVELPGWDNPHLGYLDITVDPSVRRRGLGRRLFDSGVERVRALGRRLVLAGCWDQTPGVAFLKAMGLDRAIEEIKRRQVLLDLDWAWLGQEYVRTQREAADYELVRIAGATPDDMLAGVATMTAAINDAPTDDLDIEDEVFTPARIRAFEAAQSAQKRRMYRVVARERATGMLAGHTMVGIEAEQPGYGSQFDTSVLAPHRGHRLGLLLKIDMLRWLADVEPQLRTLDTWNAASNPHMIAVNEALGYQVVAHGIEWQRHL